MIQITLQFNTIDEAIVFLSKQHPVAKVRNAAAIEPIVGASASTSASAASATTPPVASTAGPEAPATSTTNKRKPRADAGKPRGPRGATNAATGAESGGSPEALAGQATTLKDETPVAAPQTAAPTAPAEADNAQPSGVAPSDAAAPTEKPPSAPEASEKDAQDAIQKVFTQQGGPQLALDTLAAFGVKRCRDLKPEQRGDFVAKCTKLLNEIIAEKGKS